MTRRFCWKRCLECCTLWIIAAVFSPVTATATGIMAPYINQNPPAEIIFKNNSENDARLSCQANLDSNPTFNWKKDNVFLLLDNRIIREGKIGDLIIKNPSNSDEGTYQCFASNVYGTAISTSVRLKMAFLEPFPVMVAPKYWTPLVGESLSLHCSPPSTYPKGGIYWGYSSSAKLQPIFLDDRVLLDYNGSLHVANILDSDFKIGTRVVCILQNYELRSLVQGNDQVIQPKLVSGSPTYYPPALLWSSPTKDSAILGERKTMKCIFSGLPTPQISWTRLGQEISTKRVRFPEQSHGAEIEIDEVQASDGGKYECSARNSMSKPITREINLVIQSRPSWSPNKKPSDVFAAEGSDVQFECEADGIPSPSITWSINGIPVSQLTSDPQRMVVGDKLFFNNVSITDSKVVQCIAKNEHGYILKNLYLTVADRDKSNVSNIMRETFVVSIIVMAIGRVLS